MPGTIRTDPHKLRQILINLIGNAIKFTERGHVDVLARPSGDNVEFAVHDTGVEIAPEHVARLFEPFWQVDGSLTRAAGGSGLGLAVVQRYVDMLGGTIQVESIPRDGSTFRVRLPIQ